ncbi:MAG: hypothetical protein J5659_06540 [Clostridia bacterium]|nr:hypothetical protein [Clostridia bacterium]
MEKFKDENIVVISKPEPPSCGGTVSTLDKSAPKTIKSNDMTLFSVISKININSTPPEGKPALNYVHAFAVKGTAGTFLFFDAHNYLNVSTSYWLFTDENIFYTLNKFVQKYDIAKQNGYHSTTHGLPDNFGGAVNIKYSSGEKISFSDNQTPIISVEAGNEIAEMFNNFSKISKIKLPDTSNLKEIDYYEERKGGFTEAKLLLNSDGTATNKNTSKYDNKIYESENTVDKDTVLSIKQTIENKGMLAWKSLPKSAYTGSEKKKIVFVFEDNTSVSVHNDLLLPYEVSSGFFDIEFILTT